MLSDIEIADRAELRKIVDVARDELGIPEDHLVPYGHHKAKVDLRYLTSLDRPLGPVGDLDVGQHVGSLPEGAPLRPRRHGNPVVRRPARHPRGRPARAGHLRRRRARRRSTACRPTEWGQPTRP